MTVSSKTMAGVAQSPERELLPKLEESRNAVSGLNGDNRLDVRLAMKGGAGDESYAQNSHVQAGGFRCVKELLKDCLHAMLLPSNGIIRIADFGCSSGPNTVEHVYFILSALWRRYCMVEWPKTLEFQLSFVDLLSNDFNMLFRLIHQRERTRKENAFEGLPSSVNVYTAGVAGSFYGRLLPEKSLEIVFSSFSLHWLSKIPDEVQDPNSPTYNSGFVWIHGGNKEVAKAYAQQAENDLHVFLTARKEEMVSGGLMFLLLRGRTDTDPTTLYGPKESSMFGAHMEAVFQELIDKGDLSKEVRDSFNVPIYYRTLDEVEKAINDVEGFEVKELKLRDDLQCNSSTPGELKASSTDCGKRGKRIAHMCRCLLGGLVESHMGMDVANKFFGRLEELAIKRSESEAEQGKIVKNPVILAVLVRK